MSANADRSINELLAEARQLASSRPALVDAAERLVLDWKEQLTSHPPTNDEERRHYREKASEFRRLARAQLDNVGQVGTLISELSRRLCELTSPEQAAVLRDQLAPVLANEGRTVSALASVLEVCVLIDNLT